MVSMPLKIIYGNIIIILPILLSYYLSSSPTTSTSSSGDFHIAEIPISKILAQNLLIANTTRERSVLTHALLELQNPEFTVFAGAGYGVHLRHPNPGATIEPFPNGKLPQAGGSRYDPWALAKGLRYAAGIIVTDGSVGPEIEHDELVGGDAQSRMRRRSAGVSVGGGKVRKGGWLFYQEGDVSAVEAAALGWATLLLERAGAVDIQNPVGQGRNAYGEAADGMLDWLYDETKNARYAIRDGDTAASAGDCSKAQEVTQAQLSHIEQDKWAISYLYDSPQLRPETVFLVAPFLAAYAIARQDDYWLLEAIEQIRMHEKVLAKYGGTHWLSAVDPLATQSDHRFLDKPDSFTGCAWALSGMVRVLVVLERWKHNSSSAMLTKLSEGRIELLKSAEDILRQIQSSTKGHVTDLLRLQLHSHEEHDLDSGDRVKSGNPMATASVVSSVYRLAQIGLLKDTNVLIWADELYNTIASCIDGSRESQSMSKPVEGMVNPNKADKSELYSMILMMYAARRDCAELRVCRPFKAKRRGIWSLFMFS